MTMAPVAKSLNILGINYRELHRINRTRCKLIFCGGKDKEAILAKIKYKFPNVCDYTIKETGEIPETHVFFDA
jgi:hypothetical protein